MNYLKQTFISILVLVATTTAALACGANTHCRIGDRHYRIAMPEAHDGKTPVGAIVFAHGYQGSAAGIMRNKTLRRTVSNLGLALIAVKSVGGGWDLPYSPMNYNSDGSAEFEYFDAVIKDASARFPIDTKRMMATGFSAGGMMVWNLACARSNKFAAFAPMAGTFWLKVPKTCEGPVANVIHIHGTTDRTVPLKGRKIRNTHQGDVMETLDMYRKYGKFGAAKKQSTDNLSCLNRKNAKGDILDFCLFPGRHQFSSKYVKFAWETFKDAGVF